MKQWVEQGSGDRDLQRALMEAGLNVKNVEMKGGKRIVIVERTSGIEISGNAEHQEAVLNTAGTAVQKGTEYTD
jgi:hypothetical protein